MTGADFQENYRGGLGLLVRRDRHRRPLPNICRLVQVQVQGRPGEYHLVPKLDAYGRPVGQLVRRREQLFQGGCELRARQLVGLGWNAAKQNSAGPVDVDRREQVREDASGRRRPPILD